MSSRRLPPLSLAALTALLVAGAVIALYATMGQSFRSLAPGYAQHLFGVSSLKSTTASIGGVAVLQDGTVVTAECKSPTRLHIFDPDPSHTFTKNDTVLHPETVSAQITGGCGLADRKVGSQDFMFSPINDSTGGGFGMVQIGWSSLIPPALTVTKIAGPPSNAIAIAVDPKTNALVYAGAACQLTSPLPATCPLYSFDPATGTTSLFMTLPGATSAFVGGLAFDPNGDYLFIANRTGSPAGALDVRDRSGTLYSHSVLTTDPVGIGIHGGSTPFVLTNNQDGTMMEFDFSGNNYQVPPVPKLFASGGSRGNQVQAGPDGCLYVTQAQTRYNNGTSDTTNSVVQICGGFIPPPGITLNPAPPPSSLCGFVYNDTNNNGTKDTGELPIGGTTINLSGSDYLDNPISSSTTTATTDGSYCFNNLQAGTYTISEAQPASYLDGIDTQGAPGNGTVGNDAFSNISLATGYNGNNNNFGELKPSSLSGYVYADADNDGKLDNSEQGIANVTVTLTGTDDRGAAINMTGATGTDGAYTFAQLRPGTYTITETQPAAYLDGKDTQGTPGGGTAGNDVFSNIALAQNVNGQNNNFGEIPPAPAIKLVKKTNGTDNNVAPGLYVPAGSAVTWTYIVTNIGNDLLSLIAVTDDKVGAIACPATTLDIGLTMTCTATGTAIVGQYTNVGTVTAQDPIGTALTASNAENYFGAVPAIAMTKQTNGTDNDTAPGPTITAGSTVTWTYLVTNTGNVTLSNVTVNDDKAGAVTCPSKTLAPAASMTCTKTGIAVSGQYTNIGTATGTDPTGAIVTASNPDNYFGATPTLTIVTKTNGTDNDNPTGPILPVGALVTWTYTVTNTGNVPFSSVVVTDSKIGAVACPASTLDVGGSFTCTMTGTAIAGQYTNLGTATGTSAGGTITASNPDNYFGAAPAIGIVTKTNGVDGDSGSLIVPAGSPVTWTYVVTNRGNIALSSVAVTDSKLGAISCPAATLAVGGSMTCTATGVAAAGPYANVGTASGVDVTGAPVTASNPDGYFGSSPSIAIVTQTNGTNNDAPPGPSLAAGTAVNWTYVVTNTGNIALSGVAVTDNKGAGISCPAATLALGGTMTCTRTGTVTAGQYTNIGTVTAKDPIGTSVTASNPDNYFGVSSAISIVTKTNGSDNDAGPGPAIFAGATVTWTYVVTNTGNVALTQVAVTDDKAGAVACPANALAAGTSMTCTKTGIASLGPYTNVGAATGVDTLGQVVSAQNVDHYVGVEPPASDFAISMTGPASGTAGAGGLAYNITVANNGPSTVNNPVVTVPLPAGMTLSTVGGAPAGWACSTAAASPNALTCAKALMAVGESAALAFTAQLACPFPNPAPAVVNVVATASSSTSDPFPANNTAAVPLSVVNLPPTINGLSVDKAVLWPPNHKMVPITVSYTVTPACGGTPTLKVDVASNEGDASDWNIGDPHHLDLRSERLGTQKEGRIYTITVTATDPTGTSSQRDVTVTVPHDQGHGK